MVSLNAEAISSLSSALQAFLPAANPTVERSLLVIPNQVKPTGLGGFAGLHLEPSAEVFGRRIAGTLIVTLRASELAQLDTDASAIAASLLGAERSALAEAGILRLTYESAGELTHAEGNLGRELRFAVAYEFLKLPEDGGETILEIPLNLDLEGA